MPGPACGKTPAGGRQTFQHYVEAVWLPNHRMEAWPVSVNPGRFRSDEARLEVLGRTAGILGDLETAIRRELDIDGGKTRRKKEGSGV